MIRFRDVLIDLLPPWLRERWGDNYMLGTFGLWADLFAESGLVASAASWLLHEHNPDDALIPTGAERRLPQYPSESNSNYRERLWNAWPAYDGAGSEQALIDQLRLFGFAPTLATVPHLKDWTPNGVQLTHVDGPNGGNAVRLVELAGAASKHVAVSLTDVPSDMMIEVRFLARYDATREWIKVTLDQGSPEYVYVKPSTREIGATVAPGGHGTLRALDPEIPWVIVRARFWSTAATADVYLDMARSDEVDAYVGDGASWIELADVTVGTPEPMILRDNEAAAPDRIEWWSQFWVIVCEGTHPYTVGIPTADEAGILAIIKKWKPGEWSTQRAVFITGGTVTALQRGKTTNEWAALLLPQDNTALEVTF